MEIIKDMVAALNNSRIPKIKGIFHEFNPKANCLPFIQYSVISDVPSLHGDDKELQSRVTVRIHIVTKDGNYYEIYRQLNQIMIGLGFMRVQTVDMMEDGLKMKVADYRIGADSL